MATFIVYMKTISSKWPIQLYSSENLDAPMLESLEDIEQSLVSNGKVYYRDINRHDDTVRMTLYKSQVTAIAGSVPIPNIKNLKLVDVMTLNEAVETWRTISKVDTIRKAILSGRFYDWEVRKSESIWLVTTAGMTRIFGPADEYNFPSLIVQQVIYNDGNPYWKPIL